MNNSENRARLLSVKSKDVLPTENKSEGLVSSRRTAMTSLFTAGVASAVAVLGKSTPALASVPDTESPLVFNVLDPEFGARGDGITDDTAGIQNAINAASVSGRGGVVYLPATRSGYFTSRPLTITKNWVRIVGDGQSTCVHPRHSGDTFLFDGSGEPGGISYNGISNLMIWGQAKGEASNRYSFGMDYSNDVSGTNINHFIMQDVQFRCGFNGFYFQNFNTLTIRDVLVCAYRGYYRGCLATTNSAQPSSNALLQNVVLGSSDDRAGHDFIIDGETTTVTAHCLYLQKTDGYGLWVSNQKGGGIPKFLAFYNLQCEWSALEGIYLACGRRISFTDAMVHGSQRRNNIFVGPLVKGLTITGGYSTGAGVQLSGSSAVPGLSGVSIHGTDVIVNGMLLMGNTFSGIVMNAGANGIVVTNCRSGDSNGSDSDLRSSQCFGCYISSGLNNFSVTGNIFLNNRYAGIWNYSPSATQKVIANNLPVAS